MEPDPGSRSILRDLLNFFLTKINSQIFFSLIFILKPFISKDIFIISLFSKVAIWVLGLNFFFAVFG